MKQTAEDHLRRILQWFDKRSDGFRQRTAQKIFEDARAFLEKKA